MYIYVCVGVCIHVYNIRTECIHESRLLGLGSTIYIYIYIYMYVCMYVCCAYVCVVSSLVLASA